MPVLSYDDAWDLATDAVNVLQKLDLFCNSLTPNYDGLIDAVIAENIGDLSDQMSAALYAHRSGLSALLAPEAVQALMLPALRELGRACGAPEADGATYAQVMDRIRTYMVANSKSIEARNFTYGSPSAGGSNVGNGTLKRLTVDEDGFRLEGGHAEDKLFRCDSDQQQSGKHRETFTIEGEPAERDFILVDGSGISARTIRAISSEDASRIIANPTFSQFTGIAPTASTPTTATAVDAFPGWVLASFANAKATIDYAYRDFPTTPSAQRIGVQFTGNNTITQTLNTQRQQQLQRRTPYYVQVAVYREGSATGTITLTWGATTQTYALSGLTNGAWNLCVLDLDKDLYHKNFTTNDMTAAVQLSSYGGSGSVIIDDFLAVPMQFHNGTWWQLVGGSTPFKRGDTFTVADSVAGRGIFSYWLHHRSGYALAAPGFCLPVVNSSETEPDPT